VYTAAGKGLTTTNVNGVLVQWGFRGDSPVAVVQPGTASEWDGARCRVPRAGVVLEFDAKQRTMTAVVSTAGERACEGASAPAEDEPRRSGTRGKQVVGV